MTNGDLIEVVPTEVLTGCSLPLGPASRGPRIRCFRPPRVVAFSRPRVPGRLFAAPLHPPAHTQHSTTLHILVATLTGTPHAFARGGMVATLTGTPPTPARAHAELSVRRWMLHAPLWPRCGPSGVRNVPCSALASSWPGWCASALDSSRFVGRSRLGALPPTRVAATPGYPALSNLPAAPEPPCNLGATWGQG